MIPSLAAPGQMLLQRKDLDKCVIGVASVRIPHNIYFLIQFAQYPYAFAWITLPSQIYLAIRVSSFERILRDHTGCPPLVVTIRPLGFVSLPVPARHIITKVCFACSSCDRCHKCKITLTQHNSYRFISSNTFYFIIIGRSESTGQNSN